MWHKKNSHDNPIRSVAIECGRTPGEKLVNLNLFFDEVFHLPYGIKKLNDFNSVYSDAMNEIKLLKKSLKEKNRENLDLLSKIESFELDKKRWNISRLLLVAAFKSTFPHGLDRGVIEEVQSILEKVGQ